MNSHNGVLMMHGAKFMQRICEVTQASGPMSNAHPFEAVFNSLSNDELGAYFVSLGMLLKGMSYVNDAMFIELGKRRMMDAKMSDAQAGEILETREPAFGDKT